jgi:hypothetical protein
MRRRSSSTLSSCRTRSPASCRRACWPRVAPGQDLPAFLAAFLDASPRCRSSTAFHASVAEDRAEANIGLHEDRTSSTAGVLGATYASRLPVCRTHDCTGCLRSVQPVLRSMAAADRSRRECSCFIAFIMCHKLLQPDAPFAPALRRLIWHVCPAAQPHSSPCCLGFGAGLWPLSGAGLWPLSSVFTDCSRCKPVHEPMRPNAACPVCEASAVYLSHVGQAACARPRARPPS